MMGHGGVVLGVMSLIVSTAFLVWVAGKTGNPYRKFAQVIGLIAIVISAIVVICQASMCYNMCKSGQCQRMMMGPEKMMKMHGGMPQMGMPSEDDKDEKGEKEEHKK